MSNILQKKKVKYQKILLQTKQIIENELAQFDMQGFEPSESLNQKLLELIKINIELSATIETIIDLSPE